MVLLSSIGSIGALIISVFLVYWYWRKHRDDYDWWAVFVAGAMFSSSIMAIGRAVIGGLGS